jgi:hypothetical protein
VDRLCKRSEKSEWGFKEQKAAPGGRGLRKSLRGAGVAGGALAQPALQVGGEVADDRDIEQAEDAFGPGGAAEDLKQLPGQEGGGDDEGEVFGPGFAEDEAGTFQDVERGEEKDADRNLAEAMGADEGDLVEDEADEAAIRVEAHIADPLGDNGDEVLVQETKGAEAESDEKKRFEELARADQDEPAVGAGQLTSFSFYLHYLYAAGAAGTSIG